MTGELSYEIRRAWAMEVAATFGAIALSPDGSTVLVFEDESGTLKLLSCSDRKVLWKQAFPRSTFQRMVFARDGSRVCLYDVAKNRLLLVDPNDGKVLKTQSVEGKLSLLRYACGSNDKNDSETVYAVVNRDTILKFDFKQGMVEEVLNFHSIEKKALPKLSELSPLIFKDFDVFDNLLVSGFAGYVFCHDLTQQKILWHSRFGETYGFWMSSISSEKTFSGLFLSDPFRCRTFDVTSGEIISKFKSAPGTLQHASGEFLIFLHDQTTNSPTYMSIVTAAGKVLVDKHSLIDHPLASVFANCSYADDGKTWACLSKEGELSLWKLVIKK